MRRVTFRAASRSCPSAVMTERVACRPHAPHPPSVRRSGDGSRAPLDPRRGVGSQAEKLCLKQHAGVRPSQAPSTYSPAGSSQEGSTRRRRTLARRARQAAACRRTYLRPTPAPHRASRSTSPARGREAAHVSRRRSARRSDRRGRRHRRGSQRDLVQPGRFVERFRALGRDRPCHRRNRGEIPLQHLGRWPVLENTAVVDPEPARAQAADRRHVVADEQHRPALPARRRASCPGTSSGTAASPTASTSSTIRISGSRWAATANASRTYMPLRVALDRRVEELLDLGERDDLVELPRDLAPASCRGSRRSGRCSRGRSARGGSRCRLRAAMPTRPRISTWPVGRLGDPRQDLQQRALAGAVAADDADDLAPATSKETSRSAQNSGAGLRRAPGTKCSEGIAERGGPGLAPSR